MTKKEEKAIKVLEQYKNECIEEYKVELDDKKIQMNNMLLTYINK